MTGRIAAAAALLLFLAGCSAANSHQSTMNTLTQELERETSER